jgi:DNA-binding NarL/FixJ family response regulator
MLGPMIRVALVDDHYAVRLGVAAAVDAQAGMMPVGAAACAGEVPALLRQTAPDVLVVDYRLPDEDGLSLCLRLRRGAGSPALLVHSAFADDWLTLPALVAGADGILNKGSTGFQLTQAIREVARGRSAMPTVAPGLLIAANEAVDPEDQGILGMLVHGLPADEICHVAGLTAAGLHARRERMLCALRTPGHESPGRRLGASAHGDEALRGPP